MLEGSDQNAMLGVMKVLEANAASQQTLFTSRAAARSYDAFRCCWEDDLLILVSKSKTRQVFWFLPAAQRLGLTLLWLVGDLQKTIVF